MYRRLYKIRRAKHLNMPCIKAGVEKMMKVGISQLVWPGSLDQALSLCAKAQYEALELVFTPGHDPDIELSDEEIKAVGERCRAAGIEISSITGGYNPRGNFLSNNTDDVAQAQRSLERIVDIAGVLGVGAILLHPGQMDPTASYNAIYDRFVKQMRQQAIRAAEVGVTICVENVWNKFMLSPREACQLVDDVGHQSLRIYLDVGNMMSFGFPEQWIRDLGNRICRVHLKDFKRREHKFAPLTEGDAPWPTIMEELRAIGYKAALVHEVGGDEAAQIETANRIRNIVA